MSDRLSDEAEATVITLDDMKLWPYHAEYLLEILNGDYAVSDAREDILGLMAREKEAGNE